MHVLFIHQNFPAQFGQIAAHLARQHGFRCTFLSEKDVPSSPEIQQIRYRAKGGATRETHHCSRTFENQTWQSYAAFEAMQARPEIRPDLIVCHSGFLSSLFLRELYPETPQIGYFEFFYQPRGSDMDFRRDLPTPPVIDFLRVRNRNAQILLDLHNCDAGYSPTSFQRSQLPIEFQAKVRTIFDGVDCDFWRRHRGVSKSQVVLGDGRIPDTHKLVTYVSRGFEAIRGFDIFVQVADAICRVRDDVTVVVVGEDRVAYGGDLRFSGGNSFKEWAIEKHRPKLDRIHFVGRVPASQLVQLLSLSDLHLYLTAPFVLSWSMINALSCECTLLASDTAPVREIVRHQHNGLLVDFFDVDGFVDRALEVLDDPEAFRPLGRAGRELIESEYALPVCLSRMQRLYEDVCGRKIIPSKSHLSSDSEQVQS